MPKVAYDAGAVASQMSIERIGPEIIRITEKT
jgi:chemotaxis response regulator CheB